MHFIKIKYEKQGVGVGKHRTAVQVWNPLKNVLTAGKREKMLKPKNTDNTDPSYMPQETAGYR